MTVPTPWWSDGTVTLYHGDCREIVPALGLTVDLIVADPPYGETSLQWDRWQDGWPAAISEAARSMWCFGSMRMFIDHRDEFAGWHLSQDVVWEKQNGSSFVADRFKRVHETATHWYRGPWSEIHKDTPRDTSARRGESIPKRAADRTPHTGSVGPSGYEYGRPLARSVLRMRSMHQLHPIHPTEKPVGILDPLIHYGCPFGGTVLDPFAGSGSTADAARLAGRRAVLIERHEPYCELIAKRMSQGVLEVDP